MRLYTISTKARQQLIAVEIKGILVDLKTLFDENADKQYFSGINDMISLIAAGDNLFELIKEKVSVFNPAETKRDGIYQFDDVKLLAPIPRPGKIFCSGLNYKSHIEENPSAKFLSDPRFFSKAPSIVIGPDEPIKHPGEKFLVDWEVELGVVFGKKCHRVRAGEALDHVFGYTILHDVSARYIQFKDNNEVMGKNFDSFCPIGPCIVTKDELSQPEKERLSTRVNGKLMQDGTNEDWCFSLGHLIEWLSMAITLEPGDILSTGTPAGVGLFQKPAVYLRSGDVVELEISSIGKLRNPVVADNYQLREI